MWPSDGHASCAIIESHQYPVCNLKVTRLVDGEAQPSPANTSRCPESEATGKTDWGLQDSTPTLSGYAERVTGGELESYTCVLQLAKLWISLNSNDHGP